MKTNAKRTIGMLITAIFATQLLAGVPSTAAAIPPGSSGAFEQAMPVTPAQQEVVRIFKQISTNAAIAGKHADTLESYTRVASRYSHTSHAYQLNGAKDAINAMGLDLRRLQELRPGALPWQQSLIDRLQPLLVGSAGHATDAIERLKENHGTFTSEEYRNAVGNLYAYTQQTRTLVSVNLDYAQAREKLNRLDAAPVELLVKASPARDTGERVAKPAKTLEQRVLNALLKLPYYGVFDHLAFDVDGGQVTLSGEVNRPTLKTDAERAVLDVEGVAGVTNDVKVLSLSSHDDRIRLATYRAIYGQPALAQYHLNPNPPIRIIVENGHVTLKGVVGSDMDRTIAHMQANGVSGVFSVTNQLEVGL